jgi:hypothetical protein
MIAPDRLALATRTRKARRPSICPACRGPILDGMTIARLTRPPAWVHVPCVPAVAAALDRIARAAARPGTADRSQSPATSSSR